MAKFRIRELAQARKMTQEDLARQSNQSLSTIIRLWRNKGASEPRASTMLAIADALGVTIQELYNASEGSEGSDSAPASLPEGNKISLAYQGATS